MRSYPRREISCNNSGLSQEITGSHPSPLTYRADTSHSGIRPPERYGLQVLKFFPGQRMERAFRGMIQCIRHLSGGGRNLHQAQRVKRKIGGGKIPFLLSPQRKTAAILEKRKGIPFFVVPVCRRGRRRSHLRHTPYTLRKHALIASIHAFEARRACREHPAKSGIACQLRTISTMLPDTEAASPARGVAEPSNMTLDVSGDDSDALAAAPSSGADASRTSMWSVGATNCAWPVIGRPPSKSNSSSSMTAITWTEDTVVMQYRRPGMVAIGVFKAIITPTLYPEGGKKTSPRFPAVRMTGNPIRGWDAGKGRGLVFFG